MSLTDRAHSLGFSCVKGMFVLLLFFLKFLGFVAQNNTCHRSVCCEDV